MANDTRELPAAPDELTRFLGGSPLAVAFRLILLSILVTHFHGDHFAGLPFFLLDAQFSRRSRPLVIAGPAGLPLRLTQVMEALFEHSSGTKPKFDLQLVELAAGQDRTFGAVNVTPF